MSCEGLRKTAFVMTLCSAPWFALHGAIRWRDVGAICPALRGQTLLRMPHSTSSSLVRCGLLVHLHSIVTGAWRCSDHAQTGPSNARAAAHARRSRTRNTYLPIRPRPPFPSADAPILAYTPQSPQKRLPGFYPQGTSRPHTAPNRFRSPPSATPKPPAPDPDHWAAPRGAPVHVQVDRPDP